MRAFNFTNAAGCDSIISVQVIRYPEDQTEVVLEACPGETASFQGLELATGEEATVALANQYGCDSIVHAVVQALPTPGLEAITTDGCPDTASGSIAALIALATEPPYLFSLNGSPHTDSPVFEGLEAGFYTLLAQDGNGCTAAVEVEVMEAAPLLFELVLDSMACDNPVATLIARILSGDDGSLLYRWEDGSSGFSRQVNSAGIYSLQVSNSCQEATEEIRVPPPVPKEGALIYVPNAFSPNGDGNNDRFLPAFAADTEVVDYEFKVFSRWGGELFSTQNPSEGWDGAVGGRRLNAGVYAWYIQSRIRACGQERDYFLEGDVVLMR
ncbi:MAG: gliding motility-associated C-terminal domain-containing protein [Lewinellaceae bacterium]|nr:gliding motility-associated C-terminal domain-containing protein [Lewinellaceae bacterium]